MLLSELAKWKQYLTCVSIVSVYGEGIGTIKMSYDNKEKLLELGKAYRAEELADLLEKADPYELAMDICEILILLRANMTYHTWRFVQERLLSGESEQAFQEMAEAFEDDDEPS